MLIRLFLCYFSHRMDIRCFLTGFFGQEDEPSELLQFPRYCSGADKAANDRAGYIPHRDPLKPAGTYCCVFYSISTAARFTERERVPMRTIPCPLLRGNFSVTVNSNASLYFRPKKLYVRQKLLYSRIRMHTIRVYTLEILRSERECSGSRCVMTRRA